MLLRLVATLVLGTASLAALADDHEHAHNRMEKALMVMQAWSRAMPPSAPTGAVYFTLHNPGNQQDRLIGVETPRAEKAEMHTHMHEGEIMRMQQIDSVDVPAGGQVEFKPGGNHVMLFKLSQPLVAGEQLPLTLIFENAGEMTVDVDIRENAPAPDDDAHAHH